MSELDNSMKICEQVLNYRMKSLFVVKQFFNNLAGTFDVDDCINESIIWLMTKCNFKKLSINSLIDQTMHLYSVIKEWKCKRTFCD